MQHGAADQTKSPEAFRTISEVADDLDVPQHVLRFWESRFTQIKPVKRAGARRYYRPEDVDLIRGIRALLYTEGFTIKGAQKILRDKGVRHVAELGRGEVAAKGTGSKRAKSVRPKKDDTYRALRAVDFSEEPLPAELEAAWDAGTDAPVAKSKPHQATLFADPPVEPAAVKPVEALVPETAVTPSTEPVASAAPVVMDELPAHEAAVSLLPENRAKLESLLAELLSLKAKLRNARGMSV